MRCCFILLSLFTCYQVISQNITIDNHYIRKHNVKSIKILVPLDTIWIKQHKVFDSSLNAQLVTFQYNTLGHCTKMEWQFCKFFKNTIDTSISTLTHEYIFQYREDTLTKISVNSFSSFYEAYYHYTNQSIIRSITQINSNNNTTLKLDSLPFQSICRTVQNPYYFPPYPEQKCIKLPVDFLSFISVNDINILNIIESYAITLIPCPILKVEFY